MIENHDLPEDFAFETVVKAAKKKAHKIKKEEATTLDEFILQLRYWWSRKYNRPMQDPVLDKYTIKELLIEYFLHTEENTEQDANEVIKGNEEELSELFNDLPMFDNINEEVTEKEFLDKELGENNWEMSEKDFQ